MKIFLVVRKLSRDALSEKKTISMTLCRNRPCMHLHITRLRPQMVLGSGGDTLGPGKSQLHLKFSLLLRCISQARLSLT